MNLVVISKLESDLGLHEYLYNNSHWYRLLNRKSSNIDLLIKEYKQFKRNENINKFNNTIDNIDMITNVIKMM